MTRWKAAGIHLLVSVLVVALVGVAIMALWYPPALFKMAKAGKFMALIAGIDIVIGPLVTLIIYKHGKRLLKLDLAIIAALQVAFMAYGLNVMWQTRPVFLVAVPDRFELVFANEIEPADLAAGKRPEFRTLSATGPVLVGAQLPILSEERFELSMSGLAGRDVQVIPKYYVPYDAAVASLLTKAQPLAVGPETSQALSDALIEAARDAGKEPGQLLWLPLHGRRGTATMLVEAGSGRVVGPVAFDPWSSSK